MKKDLIEEMLNEISETLVVETTTDISYENKKQIITDIGKVDPDISEMLNKFINSLDMYRFIKFDKELRMKAPEMYESECKRLKYVSSIIGEDILILFKDLANLELLKEYCEVE